MDRILVSIAGEAIRVDLELTDSQLGLLNGFAFSLLYIGLGLPLARIADRGPRVTLISICLSLWSAMTALCGLVTSFSLLLICRMGVGIGEAGCLPASHSLIGDLFARGQRSTALAIFGAALPLGGMAGMVLGGVLIDRLDWHAAFLALGLPGILLAAVTRAILREPPRISVTTDVLAKAGPAREDENGSIRDVAISLALSPPARHILAGVTLATMFTSPSVTFLAPFMVRAFGLSYSEIGLALGLAQMGGIAISTLIGGLLSDRLGQHDIRWHLWIPALSVLLGAPLFSAAYIQPDWTSFVALLGLAALMGAAYLPPSYAALYSIVPARSRATTAAITGVLMNLIGLSVGPLLCGMIIDQLTAAMLADAGHAPLAADCLRGGAGSLAGTADADICNRANVSAMRFALIGFSIALIWPCAHFLRAAQHYRVQASAGDATV